jgi:hypothetical protein
MSESSKLWKVINKTACSEWLRIENRLQKGIPDCLVLSPCGKRVSWVEGKYRASWPSNSHTSTDLGLTNEQVFFLKRWVRKGGRAWLLVRVEDDFFLIHGSLVEKRLTKAAWKARATRVWRGQIDVAELESLL